MAKPRPSSPGQRVDAEPPEFQLVNTRNIIDKNLFDPERGTTKKQEQVEQRDAQARQRIRSMILLGTAILGTSKYAILQEPTATRPPAPANPRAPQQPAAGSGQMRLKQGDTLEGFQLAEVRDKSVVFTKGAIREEISIDFFRPGEPQPPPTPARAPAAGTAPQLQPRPGLAPRVGARITPPPGAEQAQANPQDAGSAVERARRALRDRQLQTPQQPSGSAPPANPQ